MERFAGRQISVVCVGGFAAGFAAFGMVYAQICAVHFWPYTTLLVPTTIALGLGVGASRLWTQLRTRTAKA